MAELDPFSDEDLPEEEPTHGEVRQKRSELAARCKSANLPFEEETDITGEDIASRIALPCGREERSIYCWDYQDYEKLLKIPFEDYSFLSGLEAVCVYKRGEIEALVRPVKPGLPRAGYARLFGFQLQSFSDAWPAARIDLVAPDGMAETTVTLSPVSEELRTLVGMSSSVNLLSVKIRRQGLSQHDQAIALLRRIADALFFQIDLLVDLPLSLARDRQLTARRMVRRGDLDTKPKIEYPRVEYDSAPISLYWYARSAVGMPLLQFLAFYQVIEFYYPTYSQAEARRRLKTILKDPTFRGDRDADIGRVLSAIHVTRSGAFGDERSQLKATLAECLDPDALRQFLEADKTRAEFFSSKAKGLTETKLPLANPSADLRNDVAERLYDIRCKIVHTKTDARTGDLELLLPFSKEAEQLGFDIELAQYVAQQVLVAASTVV